MASTRIDDDRTQTWYKHGQVHRDGNLPAIIYATGAKRWYKDGKRHRDGDLPAVMHANGAQEWFKDGERHRDGDLPAIIYATGGQAWFKDGMYHRDVGPAYVSPTNQFQYVKYGAACGARSSLGETMRGRPPASWSPVLCFI